MNAIVAVYRDWGIGKDGTQPIAISADRNFFRETTQGACVLVGRRTLADFPGGKPLKNRRNLVLTSGNDPILGAEVCHSVEEAVAKARALEPAFVIGGGSVYRQLLPYCQQVYVTKLDVQPCSDTWFPNLDEDSAWVLAEELQSGVENGIAYVMCRYIRAAGQ